MKKNGLLDLDNKYCLVIKRILFKNNTSKAFVNDIPVGINLLDEIGNYLVEIHGQNQKKDILNSSNHLEILDEYIQSQDLINLVALKFNELQAIEQKINNLEQDIEKNKREESYLKYIIDELKKADLQTEEEEALVDKQSYLLNKERIADVIQEVNLEIGKSENRLSSIQKLLIDSKDLDKKHIIDIEQLIENIEQILIKSQDSRKIVDNITYSFSSEDMNLEEIENRLFLIRNLARKFNTSSSNLPKFLLESEQKLVSIQNIEYELIHLNKIKKEIESSYIMNANKLSQLRKNGGLQLSKAVEKELSYLRMGSVNFSVEVNSLKVSKYNKKGIDNIKFTAAINSDNKLHNVSKVASGGEMSRFMLALKLALSEVKTVPTVIFDEIDTGIGGAVASSVGQRLSVLAKNIQIIIVTHQPQVAAKSHYHLKVSKVIHNSESKTIVDILDKEQKENEIARMLSGENITDEAKAAARKLIISN